MLATLDPSPVQNMVSRRHHVVDIEAGDAVGREYRRAMGAFTTGVSVISTISSAGLPQGVTASSFVSVSLAPPLVAWCIRRESASLPHFEASGVFAVSVLDAGQGDICRRFSLPSANKFEGLATQAGTHACPLIPDALAHFECALRSMVDIGDHVLLVGRVVRASWRDGDPLLFYAGSLHRPRSGRASPGIAALVGNTAS